MKGKRKSWPNAQASYMQKKTFIHISIEHDSLALSRLFSMLSTLQPMKTGSKKIEEAIIKAIARNAIMQSMWTAPKWLWIKQLIIIIAIVQIIPSVAMYTAINENYIWSENNE